MKAIGSTPAILYLTPFAPHQVGTGAQVRSRQILRTLEQVATVEVVVIEEERGEQSMGLGGDNREIAYTLPVEVCRSKRFIDKIRWACDPEVLYPHGCCVSSEGTQRILNNLEAFNMVWFYKLRTANLFPNASWPLSVVDVDDVPSTFERTAARNESRLGDRLVARLRQFSWRRRERLLGKRFSVVATCSDGDRQYLNRLGVSNPIHVIPNGIARPPIDPVPAPISPPRIGFVGLFDYRPNREGIAWFARECWPRIKKEAPEARLRLIGMGSDGPSKPAGPDIDGLGWQRDIGQEIATWSASVVPIQLGAGTRVKIAQGFSQKCPMVSTSHGAYGYDIVNGRDLLIADCPVEFADACLRLIQAPDEARQMAERAWQLFLNNWTWDAIAPRIVATVEDCLRQCVERSEITAPNSRAAFHTFQTISRIHPWRR